jgi:hypothetical protein
MRLRASIACIGAALVGLAVAGVAGADPAAPLPECPAAVPPSALAPGQLAIGFTVRSGETVEPFDVEILGVLEDGIAPGRDLIVVDTSGPVIDAGGGGISAGMSGSPVYTTSGELIGAVAYGFSEGPSSIGGVTPATDMLDVFGEPAATTPRTDSPSIALGHRLRARIGAEQGVETAAVPDQMSWLKVPLSISGGLFAERRTMLQRAIDKEGLPLLVTRGSSASAEPTSPSATVEPGDAFAAALSYGDVTDAAIGTATYVCDGKVVAFGHPFFFNGQTTLGASRASVLAIVDDPTFPPFKLAAVGDPVGIVDRDRLSAIRGLLGEPIPTVPVIQDTTALDSGRTRFGAETDVVDSGGTAAELLPFTVATHAFTNIDSTFDQIGAGSARISFAVEGIRTDSGRHWELHRANRWTSRGDISFESVLELIGFLRQLEGQRLAPIDLGAIHIDVSVQEAVREYRVGKVRWSVGGGPFRHLRRAHVRPGEALAAKVPLAPTEGGARREVEMRFRAPERKGVGQITVSGGGQAGSQDDLLCLLFGECARTRAHSFAGLLHRLRSTPRNDELVGEARVRHSTQERSAKLDRVVHGRESLIVIVGKPSGHRPHHHPGGVPVPGVTAPPAP